MRIQRNGDNENYELSIKLDFEEAKLETLTRIAHALERIASHYA